MGLERVHGLVTFAGSVSFAAWGQRRIAFTGTMEPSLLFQNVGVFVAGEGEAARRLAEDADVTFVSYPWSELLPLTDLGPIWIDDTRFLVFATARGRCIPYVVDENEEPRPIFAPDTTTEIAHAAAGGGRVVVIASVDGGAGELYELDPGDGGLRQITKEAARWFGPSRRLPEEIVVTHPSEGHQIQGWLTRATGAETDRRPLVLEIHGGPYDSTRATQLAEVLMLADAGFHVAAMNPRGSAGFGEAFARALHGQWGVPDASDLLATVDHLSAEGLITPIASACSACHTAASW